MIFFLSLNEKKKQYFTLIFDLSMYYCRIKACSVIIQYSTRHGSKVVHWSLSNMWNNFKTSLSPYDDNKKTIRNIVIVSFVLYLHCDIYKILLCLLVFRSVSIKLFRFFFIFCCFLLSLVHDILMRILFKSLVLFFIISRWKRVDQIGIT